MFEAEWPKSADQAKIGKELVEQRSATSRVYQNEDGTHTRRLYSEPTQARRPDGTWAPIELDLAHDAGGRIAPQLVPSPVSFAATAADGNLATLTLDNAQEVAFGLRGAAASPGRISGEQVDYVGVQPDADLRLSATATGLKGGIVVRSADAPTSYDLDLRLRGLTPVLDKATGDIALSDAGGAVQALVPAGSMRDEKGATSQGVRYRLQQSGQAWVLRVELEEDWLRHSSRVFPAMVDLSLERQINGDGDDTYVTTGAPGNHSAEETLKIGNEGSGRVHAAYLHFSGLASSLPNQYVVGAALNLYNVHSAACTPKPVDVYAVGAPWSGSQMTTWPGAPLAQHLSQRSFSYGKAECPAARAALPLELDRDVLTDWTHGAPFYGLSVRSAKEADTGGFKRFASAQATAENSAGVPFLDVTYSPQGAEYRVDEVTLPTANRAGQLKATVRNRGAATWTPSGPHKFGFIVKRGSAVVQTSPKFNVPNAAPNASVAMNVPIAPLPPGEYQVAMTMYNGSTDYHDYGVPYGAFALRVVNVPPTTRFQQPGSGAAVDSIRPTLYAEGHDDDNWPGTGFKYKFRICAGTPEKPADCTETEDWANATWVPPAGKLRWSQTYYWWVQVHDNVTAGEWRGPLQLNTRVPQPEITSHLGLTPRGAPAPGLDPQVGNYGMTTTDASVATVSPDLTITRAYNSLDPRNTNAFGEGWASRLDTELSKDDDGSGNVTVTLPTGRQVRFGRNHDGAYAPPMGHNLDLAYDTSTAEYTLRDTSGSQWRFYECGKLRRITDPSGLVQEIEYEAACPAGKPVSVRNLTSGRRLNLTWTGGHVTQVTTDRPSPSVSPLTWTYTYEGDRLTSACNPAAAPNCTRYDYQAGSHYRSVAVDDSPRAYWRLGETTTGGAASVTARTPNADTGTYNAVTLGVTGALAGTTDGAAAFNGTSSRIDLPDKLTSSTMTLAVELWFKTTAGGVLMSYADQPLASATASKRWAPVLYVGQDGHLRGGFWVPKPEGKKQIVSDSLVNDGRWHHVVLSGAIDTQKLYIDGVAQKGDADPEQDDTIKGLIDHDEMPHVVAGAGRTTGWPSGNDGNYFFAGNIDEIAVYQHPLGSTAIAQHAAAARQVQQLTKVTLPQDNRIAAQLTYDTARDRVATYTDHSGRSWTLDAPSRNEAVRGVVLHGPYPDYVYEFDADHGGRLTKRTYDGKTRRYEYNTARRRRTAGGPRGRDGPGDPLHLLRRRPPGDRHAQERPAGQRQPQGRAARPARIRLGRQRHEDHRRGRPGHHDGLRPRRPPRHPDSRSGRAEP
ncbi:DNRLRE domain-containing protein [Nonomuraea sp. LPB2021202275-12-8]|uniref:DNRLRE domain-containing protein n=1 Tax=Nonomuraea sp. LPB2021202275-12-8 TaxID=3120159 RepID=UPI00300C3716